MKRQEFLLASLVLAIIFIACSKKIVTGKDAAPSASTEASSVAPSNVPSGVLTPDENLLTAGKIIYETKCTRCHGLKPADVLTELRWDGILKIMIPKANLTEPEAQQVTAYLKANAKK